MPLEVSTESPTKIKDFLEAQNEKPLFLVVYASPRPTDGLMWCSDCRRAEQLINEKFTARSDQVKVVYAGNEAEWRTPSNPYRQSPFLVQKLPTIIKVTEAEVGHGQCCGGGECWIDEEADNQQWERLVEEDCYDEKKLDAFVGS